MQPYEDDLPLHYLAIIGTILGASIAVSIFAISHALVLGTPLRLYTTTAASVDRVVQIDAEWKFNACIVCVIFAAAILPLSCALVAQTGGSSGPYSCRTSMSWCGCMLSLPIIVLLPFAVFILREIQTTSYCSVLRQCSADWKVARTDAELGVIYSGTPLLTYSTFVWMSFVFLCCMVVYAIYACCVSVASAQSTQDIDDPFPTVDVVLPYTSITSVIVIIPSLVATCLFVWFAYASLRIDWSTVSIPSTREARESSDFPLVMVLVIAVGWIVPSCVTLSNPVCAGMGGILSLVGIILAVIHTVTTWLLAGDPAACAMTSVCNGGYMPDMSVADRIDAFRVSGIAYQFVAYRTVTTVVAIVSGVSGICITVLICVADRLHPSPSRETSEEGTLLEPLQGVSHSRSIPTRVRTRVGRDGVSNIPRK